MRLRKGLALLGLTALLLHLAAGAGVFGRLEARLREGAELGRMKNVTLTDPGEMQRVDLPREKLVGEVVLSVAPQGN